MLSQVVLVVVSKEDNWDNNDNFFCNFATQNVEVMDFFERHYKKIAVGWLLLLFLLWLLPRVVGVKNHNFLNPAQAGLLYLILFGIAVYSLVMFTASLTLRLLAKHWYYNSSNRTHCHL